MAGNSQRFIDAGYSLPKYMLYVGTRSVFNLSVSSFKKYFNDVNFLFVARNIYDTKLFIEAECKLIGLVQYQIIILDSPTNGQAETIFKGIKNANLPEDEPILVFNIDTIRENFTLPEELLQYDGFLEVFKGTGKNWSYAEPYDDDSQRVKRTAEKEEISNLCSTGLYYFKKQFDFSQAFVHYSNNLENELYVAPLYNYLINRNKKIYYQLINSHDVVFTGVPDEYINLIKLYNYN
ncbi:MAG: hypothetical protein ACKOWO_06530 [Sediminibacterium sp.]